MRSSALLPLGSTESNQAGDRSGPGLDKVQLEKVNTVQNIDCKRTARRERREMETGEE